MTWTQRNVTLPAHERGFHLITREIIAEFAGASTHQRGVAACVYSAHVGFAHDQ